MSSFLEDGYTHLYQLEYNILQEFDNKWTLFYKVYIYYHAGIF